MVHLTKEQLKFFIKENNIQLTVYEFRHNYFITGPMDFSELERVLRFNQPCPAAWKFSSFLKGFKGSSSDTLQCAEEDATVSAAKKRRVEDPYLDFDSREFEEAFGRLNSAFFNAANLKCLKKVLQNSKKKEDLEIGLGVHLISKLAGTVSTNRSKSQIQCPCGCQRKVEANDKMWIGSPQTWYGELDLLAGNPEESAVNVAVAGEIFRVDLESREKQDDEDFSDSPWERTRFNAEVRQKRVISQSVVFAFTERNRHRTKGAFIPSILVRENCFSFVIYNPVMDVLLVSGDIEYSSEAGDELDEDNFCRAFVFMWLILNDRIFFLHDVPLIKQWIISSSFHRNMDRFPDQLNCYYQLEEYSAHIFPGSTEKPRPRLAPESLLSMETLFNIRECEEIPNS